MKKEEIQQNVTVLFSLVILFPLIMIPVVGTIFTAIISGVAIAICVFIAFTLINKYI
jgi:hypothetical protein